MLDANVIISAVLSSGGTPARVLRAWQDGRFDLLMSPKLLAELARALAYPKLAIRISAEEATGLIALLTRSGPLNADPAGTLSVRSPDPADDYLIALAEANRALIVSGGKHLLGLAGQLPVYTPAQFLVMLDRI